MDHPAALHRLSVGVPATVEHSAEAAEGGAETGKWVAETTQVRFTSLSKPTAVVISVDILVIHHLHGRPQTQPPSQRSVAPFPYRIDERVLAIQGKWGMGRSRSDTALVRGTGIQRLR
jgi:hypothetical protein